MEQLKYNVEEYHRNEWIPLEGKDVNGKKTGQKVVKITEEEAEIMNIDANKQKIRYVLDTKKAKKDDNPKESPLQKSKRLIEEINQSENIEEIEAIAKDSTPAVIKAAEEKIEELKK
jgi:hypothetical protein